MTEKSANRYSTVAVTLHWVIAILLIANVFVGGWFHEGPDAEKLARLQWHKSIGLAVLFLSLFRLGWRFAHPVPPMPAGMKDWEKLLARIVHWGFYVVMIGVPLLGWLAVSFKGAPAVPFLNVIPAPNLPVPVSTELGDLFGEIHHVSVKGIYILLAVHVAAVLKHYFIDKDTIASRMIPGLPKRGGGTAE